MKGEAGMEGLTIVPPVPETVDHAPDPTAGVLPASVVELVQRIWSGPALAAVGLATMFTRTSSVVLGQGALLTVHRSV